MNAFIQSLEPIFKQYKIELILIFSAGCICALSIVVFLRSESKPSESIIAVTESDKNSIKKTIHIDVEGAVNKPDLYEVSEDLRLKDIISLAGGLTEEADTDLFAKNFNLAARFHDQDKIYIPYQTEETDLSVKSDETTKQKVNINTATKLELDDLSGIGPTTVDKIIAGRPYQSIDELLSRKILYKSLYEKIKADVTL